MKNIKLTISVSLILIITFLILPVHAELPVGHPQSVCFDCHPGRFSIGSEYESDDCGNCHMYLIKESLENHHNPGTCKVCHGVSNSGTYHNLHVNVDGSCKTCHGATGQTKPDKTMNDCGGCHGGKLHEIHAENLNDICLTCHGKIPGNTPQKSIGDSQTVNKVYAKVIDYNQYTLFELIKSLFGWN